MTNKKVESSEDKKGLVICHLGQGLAVEDTSGVIRLCHTRRRLGDVAVGDLVRWEPTENQQGYVTEIYPRRTVLTRPGYGGKIRPVAANLDQVIIVIAPEPEPDSLLVDQYLAACHYRRLEVILLVNKSDQLSSTFFNFLMDYTRAGYLSLTVSAKTGDGLAHLEAVLTGKSSLLVGQSGVGKSSLTNTLLPEKQLRTRELSEKAGLGKHTTTATTLYRLPNSGYIMDSPGVSVFGLADMTTSDLANGYREFHSFLSKCQFNDCRHKDDKGCAIRHAAYSGHISTDRYQRFLKLLEKMQW